MSQSQEPAPKPTNEQAAFEAAKQQFLQNQALGFMNAIRNFKTNFLMADARGEISDELKQWLYTEVVQCAGMLEVVKK